MPLLSPAAGAIWEPDHSAVGSVMSVVRICSVCFVIRRSATGVIFVRTEELCSSGRASILASVLSFISLVYIVLGALVYIALSALLHGHKVTL